ncbi:solute carrier family 25 member 45-like isoform X2 [Tubulanus polymorphus]|uniref:solute carrier family 25 member 45-like isoform X2 n=1 Tax=Tubulanus polymorphus TaxID=672921 RepID=UPI003DA1E5D3
MSNNLLHDYIAGAIGGTAGIIVGHPFDTVKVQLQTHKHVGNWGCIKTVWRAGVKSGFMRGLSFPLVGNGFLINTIYFGVYGNTLRKFTELRGHKSASYSDIFLAGITKCCGKDGLLQGTAGMYC